MSGGTYYRISELAYGLMSFNWCLSQCSYQFIVVICLLDYLPKGKYSEIYDRDLTSVGRIHGAMIQIGGGGVGGRGSGTPSP